jgi:hypothetical protein
MNRMTWRAAMFGLAACRKRCWMMNPQVRAQGAAGGANAEANEPGKRIERAVEEPQILT